MYTRRNLEADRADNPAHMTRCALKMRVRRLISIPHPSAGRSVKCSRGIAEVRHDPDRLWRTFQDRLMRLDSIRNATSGCITNILSSKHSIGTPNFFYCQTQDDTDVSSNDPTVSSAVQNRTRKDILRIEIKSNTPSRFR